MGGWTAGRWTAASFPNNGIARGPYLKLECISVARSKDLLPSRVPSVENIGAAGGWQLSTDGKHRMPDASQMPVPNLCSNGGFLPSPAAKNTSPTVNIAFLVQGLAPFSPSAPFSTLPALVPHFCLVPCLSGPLFYTRCRRPLPLSFPVAFRFPQSLFLSFSLSVFPSFRPSVASFQLCLSRCLSFPFSHCSYGRPFVLFRFNPSPNCRFLRVLCADSLQLPRSPWRIRALPPPLARHFLRPRIESTQPILYKTPSGPSRDTINLLLRMATMFLVRTMRTPVVPLLATLQCTTPVQASLSLGELGS